MPGSPTPPTGSPSSHSRSAHIHKTTSILCRVKAWNRLPQWLPMLPPMLLPMQLPIPIYTTETDGPVPLLPAPFLLPITGPSLAPSSSPPHHATPCLCISNQDMHRAADLAQSSSSAARGVLVGSWYTWDHCDMTWAGCSRGVQQVPSALQFQAPLLIGGHESFVVRPSGLLHVQQRACCPHSCRQYSCHHCCPANVPRGTDFLLQTMSQCCQVSDRNGAY